MVATRLDKKKPTTLTPGSLEAPITPVPTQPIQAPMDTGAGEMSDGTTKQVTSTFGTTQAPIETPKIEPTQVETAKVEQIPGQVKTDLTKVTKEETPTGTITTTETPKVEGITKDTQWETTDKSMNSLEQLVEARYGTIATQENGKIIADINGQKYEWTIGADGKPAKTLIGPSQTPVQLKAGDIFNQLLVNPNFNTTGYDANEVNLAKSRYKNYNTFSNMSDSQLGAAMTSGNLLKGSETYNDLMTNPALKVRLDNINKVLTISDKTSIEDKETTASDNILNKNLTLKQALENGEISGDEMKSLLQSEELTKLGSEKKERADEYTRLQTEYDQIEDQVRKELQGSGATSTAVEAEIFNRQKSIYPRLMLAKGLYDNTLGAYNDEMDRAVGLFNTNLGLYKDSQAQSQKIEDLKNQRLYEQGDLNSTDPYLQGLGIENAVNNLYSVYTIPGMESPAVKVQKVKDLMAKGMTATQAIQQLETEIRSTQRYKDYISGGQTGKDLMKMGEDSIYDPNTGKWIVKPGTTTEGLTNLSKIAGSNIQCGKAVNTYIQDVTGTYGTMGDTLDSKIKALQSIGESPEPIAGGVFVSNPANNTVGHTGIVQSVNEDGSITVLEANVEGKAEGGPLEEKTYSREQLANMVFSKGLGKQTQVNQASLPLFRSYIEDGKLPSKDALKGMNMTSEQFINSAEEGYNQYLTNKAKEISDTYPTLDVEFTPSYSTISATQREKLNESMTKIGDIDQRLEKLKTLFNKYGTEALPTSAKAEMQTLRQQIILKSKEVENLGVLNGPDLGILESLLPSTTGVISGLFSFDKNTKTKLDSIQSNYRSDAKTKGINYGARISFNNEGQATTPAQTNTATGTGGTTYTW